MTRQTMTIRISLFWVLMIFDCQRPASADSPLANYIFPAGGQRGTTVDVRVGGCCLNDVCSFELDGHGIQADSIFPRVEKTVWFEGPLLSQNESQASENYPKDYSGRIAIGKEAAEGIHHWRVWTSQGVTSSMRFVIGDLPEVVEQEIDGQPIPELVTLPITINGRIFPREDVDIWTFDARENESITCEVNAARLGSVLIARLELLDPDGQRVAEAFDNLGGDARIRFVARKAGRYQLKIHDIRFGGSQSHVYRLTVDNGPHVDTVFPLGGQRGTRTDFAFDGQKIPFGLSSLQLPEEQSKGFAWMKIPVDSGFSNRVLIQLDDLPEFVERNRTEKGDPDAHSMVRFPAVLNGRIRRAGEVDAWPFEAKAGEVWDFDLSARRLGSPLDSVLMILNEDGRILARSDDIGPEETDSKLRFSVPAEGTYRVEVSDEFGSRGGIQFAYRLKVSRPPAPDFQLRLPLDSLNLVRGSKSSLKIAATRVEGFDGEVTIKAINLPPGVTADPIQITSKSTDIAIELQTDANAPIRLAHVQIEGSAIINGQPVTRIATFPTPIGEPLIDSLALAVTISTPFKYAGRTAIEYVPVGTAFQWHFRLDRGGFDGPIKIDLSERQFRHLMGLTVESVVVPPEASEFDIPVRVPPWILLGRTGRCVIVATGTVVEPDGSRHTVSFSTHNDDDQIVVMTSPPILTIDTTRKSVMARSGEKVTVPVRIGRGTDLQSRVVKVELVTADHLKGLRAKPCEVSGADENVELILQFADDCSTTWNAPVVIRASAEVKGKSVFAEIPISVVSR